MVLEYTLQRGKITQAEAWTPKSLKFKFSGNE